MVGGIAQSIEHHHRIGHRRVDRAEPVLAIEPLADEGDGEIERALTELLRDMGLERTENGIEPLEKAAPGGAVGAADPVADLGGRGAEELLHRDALRVARLRLERHQHEERGDHRARPVGDAPHIDREPARRDHQLGGHHRHGMPGHLAEEGELDAGEDVAPLRPAEREDGLAGAAHMGGVGRIADRLQGEIGLHARREIGLAVVKERPAAVLALDLAQIDADLGLEPRVDAVEIVLEQHVFGGNGRIRLELIDEMPIPALGAEQGAARPFDGVVETLARQGSGRITRHEAPRLL